MSKGTWKISLLPLRSTSLEPLARLRTFISVDCSPEEIQTYTDLFKEFQDVFAWSYEEMSGIDPSIVEHEIKTYLNAKLVSTMT
jgi:hypothetical protein